MDWSGFQGHVNVGTSNHGMRGNFDLPLTKTEDFGRERKRAKSSETSFVDLPPDMALGEHAGYVASPITS